MQTYLQVTGDTGGIESSNGIVTGEESFETTKLMAFQMGFGAFKRGKF